MRAPSGAAHGRGPAAARKPTSQSPLITPKLPERKLYSARTPVHKSADGAAHTAGIRRDLEKSTLTERSAAQQHFLGLCDLLGQPYPAQEDQTGETYTFEKGASKVEGGEGWADVWRRGHFAWEYKGKHKNLQAAYHQLLQYREDLENPPLLVVSDMDRFEVHTNFTGTAKRIYAFALDDLLTNVTTAECALPPLDVLRALFTDPERLRPTYTSARVTEEAAAKFSHLAESLRRRGVEPEKAAHFLMRLLFCLFAEDIGLLPTKLFSRLVDANRSRPAEFTKRLRQLFTAMAQGGSFGADDIAYFDGGLFSDDEAFELTTDDLAVLAEAAKLDWSSIEPAIFGTLFERSLDPGKRSQLGAHYTSRDDILLIVEPVLMEPLRRRWNEVKAKAEALAEKARQSKGAVRTKSRKALSELLMGFAEELSKVRVLDPACGSGNFLYVALKRLLDLEKEVSVFAAENGLSGLLPRTDPSQLYGIETNVYAHELASVVVWIGYIQWQHDNGFILGATPILKPLQNIHRMDAVLAYDANGKPTEPQWPEAEVVIGNPPFLGDKKMRAELGDKYVDDLRGLFHERIPGGSDFVCYWFEKARAMIADGDARRAGLLGTQGIRGGANRAVLERIKRSGDIFWAESDRDWVLDGANVHVSMVGFDDGREPNKIVNGEAVQGVNADLSGGALDLTTAKILAENRDLAFIGSQKGGPFDIPADTAQQMLEAVGNPNGRSNSDVVLPWVNASDVTGRSRGMWIIDFGTETTNQAAAMYELPFEYVVKHVRAHRLELADRDSSNECWWLHQRPRPEMRQALSGKQRYIVTPRHSKYRVFLWERVGTVPDSALVVVARDDDYFLGVLHSKVHELWARRKGTQVREAESGFRYTPLSTFGTFPFPWPPSKELPGDPRVQAIAAAVQDLVAKRDAWLNPPGATESELKKRTLTNLYNQRPTWLADAHRVLDLAVLAAYGWPFDISDDEILARLLALNQDRAGRQSRGA